MSHNTMFINRERKPRKASQQDRSSKPGKQNVNVPRTSSEGVPMGKVRGTSVTVKKYHVYE